MPGDGRPWSEGKGQRPAARLAFLVGLAGVFFVLDWLTFLHERPSVNITPWNPPAGLYFCYLLIIGWRGAPLALAVVIASDVLVRAYPGSLPSLALSNSVVVAIYAAAAHLLRKKLATDLRLSTMRDLSKLIVGCFGAATLVAPAYIGVLFADGLVSEQDLALAIFQYWLGDLIATTTITPALLVSLCAVSWRSFRTSRVNPQAVLHFSAQLLLTAGCLAIAIVPLGEYRPNLFHILFLPLMWIAVSRGLFGTLVSVICVETAIVVGLDKFGEPIATIVHYQTLMLTLALTSLLIASLTAERARIFAQLRQHQAELAHAGRLATAGEMASALAHELNQPLLACISYSRAAQRQIDAQSGNSPAELIRKAVAQAERAAEVIKGLRRFLRKGTLKVEVVPVADIVEAATALARADASYNEARVLVHVADDMPNIRANKTQIEQVLLNLIHNAVEAMVVSRSAIRSVYVSVTASEDGRYVCFDVRDSGPGVPREILEHLFTPFATTKNSGMGLGLVICKTIVEAHGGRLYLSHTSEMGACFRFKIPVAGEEHASDDQGDSLHH